MEVGIIINKNQYERALQRFEEIFLAKPNTKEGKEAQLLARAIESYENLHFKIGTSK